MLLIKALCLLLVISNSLTSQPITTPIKWEGLDTLSKFYRTEKMKKNPPAPFSKGGKQDSGPTFRNGGKEECKIPFQKHREDELLGEPISDPRVVFSTYVGGNGYDCGNSVSYDSQENIYIVGYSGSTNMATTEGCYQKDKKGGHDAFIGKFTNKGKLIWMTYLGGNNTDVATDCIVDDSDNLIVVGMTNSPDFPFTEGSYYGSNNGFLTKFNSDGKMLWSKFFGDSAYNAPQGIAIAENGNFVMTGYTYGHNLTIKEGAYQATNAGNYDTYIAKFTTDGNLIWSTYFGGGNHDIGTGIACDRTNGVIAVCGYTFWGIYNKNVKFPVSNDAFQKDTSGLKDIFVALFDSSGHCKWSTLLGGKDDDVSYDVAIDDEENVIITGFTYSINFPISELAYQKNKKSEEDIFLSKFDNSGSLTWSTYFGGNNGEESYCINSDSDNNIWITGYTLSTDFPTTKDAIFKSIFSSQATDTFFGKLTSNGFPTWMSCYISRAGIDFAYKIKTLNNSKFVITGETDGNLFPVTANCFQVKYGSPGSYDCFLVLIDLLPSDVQEPNPQNDFSVYPNPAVDFLEISFPDHALKDVAIHVYNVFGEEVLTTSYLTPRPSPKETNHVAYFLR